ncbi:MAG: hypothetical protein KAF40_01445 [Flavihumibacter sp.]|nr:hypothetical protein [Flavihumibacter sp.]
MKLTINPKGIIIGLLLSAAILMVALTATSCSPSHATCQNDRIVGQGHDHWKNHIPKAPKRRVAKY